MFQAVYLFPHLGPLRSESYPFVVCQQTHPIASQFHFSQTDHHQFSLLKNSKYRHFHLQSLA